LFYLFLSPTRLGFNLFPLRQTNARTRAAEQQTALTSPSKTNNQYKRISIINRVVARACTALKYSLYFRAHRNVLLGRNVTKKQKTTKVNNYCTFKNYGLASRRPSLGETSEKPNVQTQHNQ